MRSKPTVVFGIHSFTPYDPGGSGIYGISEILASSTLTITGELIELFGGSQKAAWAIEDGADDMEISVGFKHIESWMFQLFLGAQATVSPASATGDVTGFENAQGTSLKSATTGISSIGPKSGKSADMKRSKYMVKAVSATTVDVYALTNVDFSRGVKVDHISDDLKITATPLSITAATGVEVPNFGIELTGGSGTIAMTPGDSAFFEVFPPYQKKQEVLIGGPGDLRPEFGALIVAQKSSTGQMFDIDCFRCKGSGFPIGMTEKAFAEPEVTVKPFLDPIRRAVAKVSLCA